jgi:hypothetical protein
MMLRLIFLLLFSVTLFATHYPQPYHTLAEPLFKARVQLDPLVYHDTFREKVLHYQRHADRVLGHYYRLKHNSDPKTLAAYKDALIALKVEYTELKHFLHRQLDNVIQDDNYDAFISIITTMDDADYSNPYRRESIYTYYQAHRHERPSACLDRRIAEEYQAIAAYTPEKYVDYRHTPNARYREVILITIPQSPYGEKVRRFFKSHHVRFTAYDLNKDAKGEVLFDKHRAHRIPLVIIDNHTIEGYNAYEMDRLLRR